MKFTKDTVFALTIFLTIGTVLLAVAVVVIGCFLRKLRKRVEEEFFAGKDKVERVACTDRVLNKYTPSKRKKCEDDPECYESPPLTEAQRERLQNAQNTSDDAEQRMSWAQQNELIEMNARSSDVSYIEFLNDENNPGGQGNDEDYEVAIEDCNDNLTTFRPNPKSAKPKQLPTQAKHGAGHVTQQPMSRNPGKIPYPSSNAKGNPAQRQQPKVGHSNAASREKGVTQLTVTQLHAQWKAMRDTRESEITGNQAIEEEYYYQVMKSQANQAYDEEDFYGNQEIIDSVQNTGSPTDEDEIYENRETIARQKANEYRHVVNEEQLYINYQEDDSHVTSGSHYLQFQDDWGESEDFYVNESHPYNC